MNVFVYAFLSFILIGCSCRNTLPPDTVNDDKVQPTYSSLATYVFRPSCVSCHTAGNAAAGVNLSSYDNIMFSQVVREGDHTRSSLYTQVNSGSMPRGGAPLSQQKIKAIADWIDAGALNN